MIAESILYRGVVTVYASKNKETLRISTGVKASKLTPAGLVPATVDGYEKMNQKIRKLLFEVQELIDSNPTLSPKLISYLHKHGELPIEEALRGKELNFIQVFEKFIRDSESGERLKGGGKPLSKGSIENYKFCLQKLIKFSEYTKYDLKDWKNINNEFYNKYCTYCWTVRKNTDNSVGKDIIYLRTVVKWMMKTELTKHKINISKWEILKEPSNEDNFLIFFESEITLMREMPIICKDKAKQQRLEEMRDCLLLGIYTCLRLSDLTKMTEEDLLVTSTGYYILKEQEKTKKVVKIPLYAGQGIDIIEKYRNKFKTLLPHRIQVTFNNNLRALMRYFIEYLDTVDTSGMIINNWKEPYSFTYTRNNKRYKEDVDKVDMVASHICRKSGISYLLSKGMEPTQVKSISGHKFNSESFYKYIKISEEVMNKEHENIWNSTIKKVS